MFSIMISEHQITFWKVFMTICLDPHYRFASTDARVQHSYSFGTNECITEES